MSGADGLLRVGPGDVVLRFVDVPKHMIGIGCMAGLDHVAFPQEPPLCGLPPTTVVRVHRDEADEYGIGLAFTCCDNEMHAHQVVNHLLRLCREAKA